LKKLKNDNYFNLINIRAHHLLCMQGFQGFGYSKDFEQNMQKYIDIIRAFPLKLIEITTKCDVICYKCPHNVKESCQKSSEKEIKAIDKLVLKKLNLKEGSKVNAKDIFTLINRKLRNYYDIHEICGNCSWKVKCLFYKTKKQIL
jgi:uncharacterized protein